MTQQAARSVPAYVGALDQGTTSTRFMIFDIDGRGAYRLWKKAVTRTFDWVETDAPG